MASETAAQPHAWHVASDIASAISFDLLPLPNVRRQRAEQLIDLAIALLPAIEDDVVADMVEELAIALSDADQAVLAERELVTAAMNVARGQHVELGRLRERYAAVTDELRALRRDP